MNRFVASISLSLIVLVAGAASGAARLRVYAKVDAETSIYPGQDFVYSIVVQGGAKPSRIDLSPIAQFKPRRAGSGTYMETVGDRTTISYSQNYVITAGEPGTMVLPGVTVVVGGQTYTTNPVEVTVSRPGTTDRFAVEFSLSEARCYVGQPIVMKVRLIATARAQEAAFDVPVFKSGDFYIEEVSVPAGAWATVQTTIHGVPVTATEERRLVKGVEAAVISFSKILIPKRAGRIVLEPVTISTNMAVGRVRTGNVFNPYMMKYERVSVQSDRVELEALPLPETGKPPLYYGLVGRYTITASATPTKVSVGDPITLTIRIGGNPYLKPVQWPPLEQVRPLADNFKVPAERASPVVDGGEKVFTQTIRANNDAVTEVPSIPLAYFDAEQGRYAVAETKPIKLDVASSRVLTNADLEGTGPGPVNRKVEAIRKGLSANYYGPEVLVNQGFSPLSAIVHPGYAVLWSVPLIGLMVSSVVKLAGRSSPEAIARKRRRQARGAAVRQLRTITSTDPKDRPDLLISAMKGYIGDRFDRVAASLTPDECYDVIVESTREAQTAGKYRDKIAECEAARYAPVDAEIRTNQVEEAITLIDLIERQSRK